MLKQPITAKYIGTLLFVMYFLYCIATPTTWHFIDTINLIFHEAGHAICFFLPPLLTAFMGSGFQILIPTTFIYYFYQRGEVLSAYLLFFWLAQNIMNVSVYVRDAIPMQLELLGGDSSIHDWNFILDALGLLHTSTVLADILVIIASSIALGSTYKIISYFIKNLSAGLDKV